MNYREAVAWLYGTQLHGIKLGLDNTRRLVAELSINLAGAGAPKFIHVAGTNGKGSTCAMLDAICRAAGLRTALFTSPHLVTFRERFRFGGQMISEEAVAEELSAIRKVVERWEHTPTFFEIATALGFSWFQKCGAEIVVLETGMGGRLDATNVVTPITSIITPIEFDHQQWLGTTLSEIAAEKAGIIKPGSPVVCAPQHDQALCVLAHLAMEREAPFHLVVSPLEGLPINLAGEHQRWNAALAVHALEVAGLAANSVAIARGLREVQWPGRFQQIGKRVIVDGAHNPAAARCLRQTWGELHGAEKATLVVGVLKDKHLPGIAEALLPIAARMVAVPVRNERTCRPDELAGAFRALDATLACRSMSDLASAIEWALDQPERVLITGSLFLVGEAIALLENCSAGETSAQ